MNHTDAPRLDATMDQCLAAIIDLGRARDLGPAERTRRLTKLAGVALGAAGPEAGDDPTVARLRDLDATLREHPTARDAWRARVRGAIVAASSGAVAFARSA